MMAVDPVSESRRQANSLELPQSDHQALARDHLANERTFLAWVRTGLAVVIFGFAIGRFAIAIQEFLKAEQIGKAPRVCRFGSGWRRSLLASFWCLPV